MPMSPRVRTFALTVHVTSSVGWLGAVAGFLALALAGVTGRDAETVRAAYIAMKLTAWLVIVPLSLASPLTGLVQSLGTTWGLFRHYWILAKLLITIPATFVLLLHMQPIGRLAGGAAETTLARADLRGLRVQLVVNAAAALLVLLAAAALSVYKPRGLTRYGRRMQNEQEHTGDIGGVGRVSGSATGTPRWVYALRVIVVLLLLLFVILHLTGGGLGAQTVDGGRE
jgi:uncharacterized membrane protein